MATVQRKIVEKPKKETVVPMRYKIDPPEGYAPSSTARKNSKTSAIGQGTTEGFSNSNSSSSTQLHSTVTGHGSVKAQSIQQETKRVISSAPPIPSATMASTSTINRHQKIYSRDVSIPKLFREISHLDSELQVHLEYSTSRRMPMTEEQQKWLLMKETDRQNKYKAHLQGLGSGEGNGGPTKSNEKDVKDKNRKTSTIMPAIAIGTEIPILENPHDIMEKKFPIFDSEEYPEAQGELRCQQLEECNRVYEALSKKFPNVDMNVIERALLIPQDRNTVRLPSPSSLSDFMIRKFVWKI